MSFAIQTICLIIAAALIQGKVVPDFENHEESMTVLIPLVFLSLQAGGQVSASDILGYPEIPTTVLTSVYLGLASNSLLGGLGNPKRNRRIANITLLLLGAIAGGWLSKSHVGIPVIFWISAGLKLFISAAWLFWKEEIHEEE